jgi:restriction system protein
MNIWTYEQTSLTLPPKGRNVAACSFCRTPLDRLVNRVLDRPVFKDTGDDEKWIDACPRCGWWVVSFKYETRMGADWHLGVRRATGTLRSLDLSNVSVPTEEVRQYLLARYTDRLNVHPRKYEDVVAEVFRDFGYRVRVTSYSGDDGIDVFVFDGKSDDIVGIQVKRTKNDIEASQIREFAGALVLNGSTQGVFVTTEDFTRGAVRTASRYQAQGLAISLCNAASFYDKLQLTTRPPYLYVDDPTAPFAAIWKDPSHLPEVYHDSAGYG